MISTSAFCLQRPFIVSVLSLALPVAAQMLLQSVLGMADVAMVGALGATPLAAVGLAAKIQFLLFVMMSGIAAACGILVAQYQGAGNLGECRRVLASTLAFSGLCVLPFVALLGLGPTWWLAYLNPNPEVVAIAAQYLSITAPILLMVQVIVVLEAALRSLGQTALSLSCAALSALLNIVFNYVLIFGKFGFPELGAAGAAWGTLLARSLQLLCFVLWLQWRRHEFRLLALPWQGAIEGTRVKHVLLFSLPLVANYFFWAVGNTSYHILTGFAGTSALAVMGVMVPLEMAFFAIFYGLACAASVMIGQSLGADDKVRAWQLFRIFDYFCIALVAIFCLSLWLNRELVLGLYRNLDSDTMTLLENVVLVFCFTVWIRVLNMMRIVGVLRAGGDTRFCLWLDMIVMWCLGVPVYAAAVFFSGWSFVLLYALIYLEDVAKIIPVHWRLRGRHWLRNLTR